MRVLGTAIAMLATPLKASAPSQNGGQIAWVIDGDTFRLKSGERIRIAGIDAPETQRGQAKCRAEIVAGEGAKRRAIALLKWRTVTFVRVGRSYNRTVASVRLDGRDLGATLVGLGIARPWLRGRPKPDWCAR